MRWSIIILIALSLACSKKQESAPAESEKAAETEAPSAAEEPSRPEAAEVMANPVAAMDFNLEDLPALPPELGGETPPLDAPPTVIVLDQGKEPRQALRYATQRGFEQKLTADLGLSVDALIVLIRSKMPRTVVSYGLTMQAKEVNKDGTVRVAFKVEVSPPATAAGTKPERTEAQERAPQQTTNFVGNYTLSPGGAMANFELAKALDGTPANPRVTDSLRWALVQMTPALPAEPVGPGAKWTVHESIIQGGIHVNQLRTIELVRLDGKRMELSVEVRQSATAQPYSNPLTGAKFELENLHGMASGSLTWDLGELAPRGANIEANALDVAVFRNKDRKRKASVVVHHERTVKVQGK